MSYLPAVFLVTLAALVSEGCRAQEPVALPVVQVGYVDNDVDPAAAPASNWGFEGGIAWDYAHRSFVVELEQPALITGVRISAERVVSTAPCVEPAEVQIYTSMDNRKYTRYEGDIEVTITTPDVPGEFRRVDVTGLRVFARYIKLTHSDAGSGYGIATSSLRQALKVFGPSLGAAPAINGLHVEPAQVTGALSCFVLVSAPTPDGTTLQFEVQNAETWESFSFDADFRRGEWTAVSCRDQRLMQGAYWLTARLEYDGAVVAQASAAFRVHAQALSFEDATTAARGDTPLPGGALVSRNLPDWCHGGEAFDYTLPHEPRRQWRGLVAAKGQRIDITAPAGGECAAYIGVSSPWPTLEVTWGAHKATIAATQSDWKPQGGTQELFLGFGQFGETGPTVTAVDGDLRIHHLRLARLSGDEAALAHHVGDPTANRRVIYNNDGFSEFFGQEGWDQARLRQLVERYQGTDCEFMELAAFVSGAVSFPSEYATFWRKGEVPDDQWLRRDEMLAIDLWNDLELAGLPIYSTLVARGRELGIPVWGSLRMSAYYGIREEKRMQPFNGKLWHEHPEFRIRERSGAYATQMSFAWPQVREQRIGVLVEMAQMGCEGVMMDFCRYPEVLGYDEPLVESFQAKYRVDPLTIPADDERWVRHRCELMNDFFRAVRAAIEQVGREQGRKIRISVRVPATGYESYGFDPQTWARERLMDVFIPHYPGLERDFDAGPWVALARPNGILVYPGIEPTKEQTSTTELTDAEVKAGVKPGIVTNMTPDDYRRKVWRRYRQGADGVFLFNLWTIGPTRNLLGDKEALRRWSYFEDPMNLPRTP